jgi:hypothetical protein
MKKKTKRNPLMDYIKALRKGSRDSEIELYGKPLPKHKIHKSKKIYNRKNKDWKSDSSSYFFFILRGFIENN